MGCIVKLHFGVLDGTPWYYQGYETIGEVAKRLESDYGILEKFFENNQEFIANEIAKKIFTNKATGTPFSGKIFLEDVAEMARKFLNDRSLDGTVSLKTIPTKASLRGVNTRLGITHGPERPSFIDGGAYREALRVWVES